MKLLLDPAFFWSPKGSRVGSESGMFWDCWRDNAKGFVYTADMSNHSDSTVSFSADARRAFYEAHRSVALFMLLVVFASPFAGLYVAGLIGVVVGVLASAAAYVLTPYCWRWIGD